MDDADRAFLREEELRQDALAAMELPKDGLLSLSHCELCESPIPVQRQQFGGVVTCIDCQMALERSYR